MMRCNTATSYTAPGSNWCFLHLSNWSRRGMVPWWEPPPSVEGLNQILCTFSQLDQTFKRARSPWQPSSQTWAQKSY